ncbi:MAG TPA: DUF3592 domain-containing protein [Planctomycetota bacterium]|nr:DUF3592 domain-containing protein [Planctomycetota bacterium]
MIPDQPPEWVLPAMDWAFSLMGSAALLFSIIQIVRRCRFVGRALRAPGRVVEMQITQESSLQDRAGFVTMYRPIIKFETAKGETVKFESKVKSSSEKVAGGRPLIVLYDPDRPTDADVDSFLHLWFFEILMGVLGGVFLAIGLFVL